MAAVRLRPGREAPCDSGMRVPSAAVAHSRRCWYCDGVVATEHRLALEQLELAGGDVVVEDGLRASPSTRRRPGAGSWRSRGCRRGRPSRPARRTRGRGAHRSPTAGTGSRASTRRAVSPSRRRDRTATSSKASMPWNRSPGCDRISGCHWSAEVASIGAQARSESRESALCTMRSRSPAGSTSYSTPSRRGATTRKSPVGSAASRMRTSDVVFDPRPIMIQRSSREDPTPIQNRSSSSWWTSTSSSTAVPTSWRQTWWGRQVSSTRV